MPVAIYDENSGHILSVIYSSSFPAGLTVPENCATLMVPAAAHPVSPDSHMVQGGDFILKPLDLTEPRRNLWAAAKAHRDQVVDGGCPTPLGVAQTDAESRLKISGAVQMAMLAQMAGQPFAINWTMKNNSAIIHNANATLQLGLTVGGHVNAAFETATGLRARIDAAQSLEDLEAIDILGAPWPPNA